MSEVRIECFSPEEATLKTKYLINELNRGHQLFISDCRWLQDNDCELDVRKKIYLYHIQKSVPEITNLPENDDSDSYANYWDLICIAISDCVSCNDKCHQLPKEFMADVIMFSKNIDSLSIISQMEENDLEIWDGAVLDIETFNYLRRLAHNRLVELGY